MVLKLRSKRGVWVFTICVTLFCVLASLVINTVVWAFAPPPAFLMRAALGTALLAFPAGYFIGLQLRAVCALSEQLEHAMQFDPLTGTLRRGAFFRRSAALRACGGVLIIVDIDNFRAFNETHGHLGGDAALRQVAQKLSRCTREHDLVARFGGEEFLVLLPGTALEDGKRMARELRSLLSETPVIVHGRPVTVTASFGVAHIGPNETVAQALSRADDALYRAKRSGRDTVCIAA